MNQYQRQWIVTGDVTSVADGEAECADLPGVEKREFAATTDLPPEALDESFHWTVKGRSPAEDVASCFKSVGAVNVKIRAA